MPSARDILVLAQIVDMVRAGAATTRPELEALTGLGRTVVNERLREGVELGVLAEVDAVPSGQRRGRPSRSVRFRTEAGLLLSAALGAVSLHAAVFDLGGTELAREFRDIDMEDGPEAILGLVHTTFGELIERAGRRAPVWGITIGIPGPVDVMSGHVVAPPSMPNWNDYDVRSWFQSHYETPVWVDNEVNLMALGEWERGVPQERRDLLYVKVATGIGSGLVTNGHLHRGDSGAAGDIGHVRVTDDPTARCRCGKTGCLEAVASGWALMRALAKDAKSGRSTVLAERLARRGRITAEDIGHATAAGDEVVRSAVTSAAQITGRTIAGVVNFANPGTLVLGGGVIRHSPLFFDEFRRAVLDGAIELAARNLTIRTASLNFAEGTIGGALLAAHNLFRPAALRIWLGSGTPVGSALRLHAA
ncbi:ROK family protein [Actinoallomurus iriomotensis]|uniref:Sugar kinase n=1 Tax=Actinoallomurus iriomotensis TaxID=478107 RepID=A0A9W6RXN0_9ACTN|nr:ROK family protein [Actinoallomurus iriomotensis]GLY81992.1 sugar kinase [Actinoallomurus iriomotensis]